MNVSASRRVFEVVARSIGSPSQSRTTKEPEGYAVERLFSEKSPVAACPEAPTWRRGNWLRKSWRPAALARVSEEMADCAQRRRKSSKNASRTGDNLCYVSRFRLQGEADKRNTADDACVRELFFT